MNEHEDDLFRRNQDLEDRLAGAPIEQQVHALITSGKRNRHLIRLTVAGLALDLVLSLMIGYQWHRTDTNAESIHSACVSRNKSRAEQINLWQTVITLSVDSVSSKTPAEIAERNRDTMAFQRYLRKVFAPVKCQ